MADKRGEAVGRQHGSSSLSHSHDPGGAESSESQAMEWRSVPDCMDFEPSFLQGNTEVTADSERSRCIPTDDLKEASDILQETGRVILCGFPGTGKTTVGHALLRRCREEGFKPYILSKLEDWHAHIGPGRRSFVLIDGLMGVVRVNRKQYEEWTRILRNILELIKAGDCRVVVTLYPHVLHELQQLETDSQSPLLDSSAVVRLMKEDLGTEVKRELLDFHLKQLPLQPSQQQEVVERIVQADTSGPAFLWCCRYLVDHWQAVEDPATVFTSPAEANSVLLKQMCLHDTHGDSFAAVFVLTMLGKGQFLETKVRAQVELIEHGFQGFFDDHLAKYEDILLGSVLASQGHGFISRVMYDAVGLALGRSFRLPTLIKVCDVTFLMQNILVNATEGHLDNAEKVLAIQVGSRSFVSVACKNKPLLSQSLIERLHEEITKGNLREISQHPALQCPELLLEVEKYCEKKTHSEHHLLRALDTVYTLPLIYWSVRYKCHSLMEWCIEKMINDEELHLILQETLLAFILTSHLAHESRCNAEEVLFRGLLAAENCHFSTEKVVLSREFVVKHSVEINADVPGIITGAEQSNQQLLYLCNTFNTIPPTLFSVHVSDQPPFSFPSAMVSVQVLNDTVTVQVRDIEDWYLALRLLADREVDETDRDGNTLLHIAADKGNLKAITLAVKSGASLTKTNNKGLTPYQLAQRRREKHKTAIYRDNMRSNLYSAVRDGDEVTVKTLLCCGRSINDDDTKGSTYLTVACQHVQENIADLLIALGADVNIKAPSGWGDPLSPLHHACRNGLTQTAAVLIKHQADINAKNHLGQTSHHCACQCESLTASADITRLLLDAGADVHARDWRGNTSLHYASRRGHTATVALLTDHGADVNEQDEYGITPLHCVSSSRHTDTLTLLIHRGADLNAKDKHGRSPLHCYFTNERPDTITQLIEAGAETGRVHQAVVRGDVDALMTLLQQGADVNQHDTSMGCSPLHAACLMGRTDIVACLTQHGAKVNAVDDIKRAPLHIACQVARRLIDDGAELNVRNESHSTPIHKKSDNTEIVQYILQHGADVNAVSEFDVTPLHTACENGRTETVKCLLLHGAKLNAISQYATALHKACENGHTGTVQYLLQKGADVNNASELDTPLHTACGNGHTVTAMCLLRHGANVNAVSWLYGTPLHVACKNGHTQTVLCLLQHGANVNAVSKWPGTPLHTACEEGHTETVECLLQHGADVNAVSELYNAPLYVACNNGHTETARCLLQHGANVNTVSGIGTPLHTACINGHTETAQCLLQHKADANAVSEWYGTPLDVARRFEPHCDDVVTLLVQHGAVCRDQITRAT